MILAVCPYFSQKGNCRHSMLCLLLCPKPAGGIPVNGQRGWSPDEMVSTGRGVKTAGVQVRSEIHKQDDFFQAGEYYRSISMP